MSRRIGLTLLLIACLILPLVSPQASLAQRSVEETVVDLEPRGLVDMDRPDAIPGEYIVVFEDTTTPDRLQATERLVERAGGNIKYSYGYALKGFSAKMPEGLLKQVVNTPGVKYIIPNIKSVEGSQGMPAPKTQPMPAVDDSANPQPDNYTTVPANSWGRDRITQRWLPLDGSYHYSHTGAGVHVYVIDSGIRRTHAEFQPHTSRVGPGWNVLEQNTNVYDCDGHGTATAGIIGGNTVGVAPGVIIHPVQVSGFYDQNGICQKSNDAARSIAGINWVVGQRHFYADNNIDINMIIQLNIGGYGGYHQGLYDSVNNAVNGSRPIPLVIAAHNQNLDACDATYAWNVSMISVPYAIGVGGFDQNDARFRNPDYANGQNGAGSNYGPCVDVFAPSNWVRTANITHDNCYTADPNCTYGNQQQYFYGGTSAAGPHVGGVAALLAQQYPHMKNNPPAIEQAIILSSTKGVLRNNNNNAQETLYVTVNGTTYNDGAASLGIGSPNRVLYAFNHHHTWGRLVRGNNTSIGKHWASTLPLPAGFSYEYSWQILENSQANTRPLYACTHPSLGQNVISTNANCEGLPGKTNIGHVFTSQVAGTIPIYRCSIGNGADHFISPAANCEGQVVNYLLGYGYP